MSKSIACHQLAKTYPALPGSLTQKLARGRKKFLFSTSSSSIKTKALIDINFSLEEGDILGIIGQNGSGKSTLLKLLAHITPPTQGSIEIKSPLAPLIELGAGFQLDLSGHENIYLNARLLGMKKGQIDALYEQIVDFSELGAAIHQPLKTYSNGMYLRLAFAVAAHTQPQVILIDEILTVGDLAFQQKCLRRLQKLHRQGVTIVLVSHNINLVRTFCNRVLYLEKGRVKKLGAPEEVCDLYLQDLERKRQFLPTSSPSLVGGQSLSHDYDKTGLVSSPKPPFSLETPYQDRLYSPTFVTKVNSTYYLVDCWHHRVLYNSNLIDKVTHWSTLSDQLAAPHSLASDGHILVTESSDHHQLHVFSATSHQPLQTLSLPGLRPHRTLYSPSHQLFFCLCAQSQTLITLRRNSQLQLETIQTQELDFLRQTYTRSLSLINDIFYFVAGSDHYQADRTLPPTYDPENAHLIAATWQNNSLVPIQIFPVVPELANMNDVFYHQGLFYLTATLPASPGQIAVTSQLAWLDPQSPHHSQVSHLGDQLQLLGTPYYLSYIDGRLYIPEISEHSRLTSCKIINDELQDIKHQYDFGPATHSSIQRKKSFI